MYTKAPKQSQIRQKSEYVPEPVRKKEEGADIWSYDRQDLLVVLEASFASKLRRIEERNIEQYYL